jgi:WD40 repeat protein/serine/threonine protein kinase
VASLFLSYRRSDSPDTVKLIHERLQKVLPRWEIFYDHQSIRQGEEFPELLRTKVTSATAVLVIIGPQWLEILHQRRGGAAVDHVREEVRLAMEAGNTVIPVTVGNAGMPKATDLVDFPELQSLLTRNGREVRPDPHFDADIGRIAEGLEQLAPGETVGAVLAGKYKIVRQIGEGGMGIVYIAEQTHPIKRTVALKMIKPGMDSREILARFNAERQALAVMDHPNIAKVLDADTTSRGHPFFVMEYVKGIPITQYCDEKKLATAARLQLFAPVCQAVQHAHQKGIIHRDIKPSNVLVEEVDGKAVPKVIDFGLAKALNYKLTDMTLLTAMESRVGTLEYSSPEQAGGRTFDIDTRTDIYSLGALLYEILTGTPPFSREQLLKIGEEEMRRVIREQDPPKPSTRLSSSGDLPAIAARRQLEPAKLPRMVRGDLDWIVMKCLEKDRDRRYKTANQLAQELQHFLAGEPVEAGPPSARYRLMKLLSRNKVVGVGAALLLLLVAGLIGTSIGLVQSEWGRDSGAAEKSAAGGMLGTKNAVEGVIANTSVPIKADDGHREAEIAALRARFGMLYLKFREEPGSAMVGSAQLLPEVLSLKDRSLADTILLLVGGWLEEMCRLQRVFIHREMVEAAVFSPDGKTVLTGSWDQTARLWDVATGKPVGLPLQTESAVHSVAFSPDGKTILTGSDNGTARLWDAPTGKAIGAPLQHRGPVLRVAFSPDSKTVLTGSNDKTARLWSAATGRPTGRQLEHQDIVYDVAFSPDGQTVLTGSGDNTARLWEVSTGNPIGPPLKHQGPVASVAFSPDGKTVLTGSGDKTARLWDAATGRQLGSPLLHKGDVMAVAFSPDGKAVLTGSLDKTARVWDAASGQAFTPPLQHTGVVVAVAFSPDGRNVLTGSMDESARLWEAGTGTPVGLPLQHQGEVQTVAFSPDGRTVLTASRDRTARLWDAVPGRQRVPPLQHRESVNAVTFSPDGKSVLTGSADRTARLWEAATGTPIGPPLEHQGEVKAIAFSPDGKTLLTGSQDKTARLWDAASGKQHGISLQHQGTVTTVAFSSNSQRALTGSEDKTARVWDAATGEPLGPPLQHKGTVWKVAFSPDDKTVATASADKTARLWDAATGKIIGPPLEHEDAVFAVAFNPDGKKVLTASLDTTARQWDSATGKLIGPPLKHQSGVFAAAFSPDGKTIVTGSTDKTARQWDAITGMQLGPSLLHKGNVIPVTFSPDGRTVLTGSWDKTARLWVAITGEQIGSPMQHQGPVWKVAFSPDGKTIATASDDKTARLWKVPQPLQGNPEQIVLWVQLTRGYEIGPGGEMRLLDAPAWHERWRRLQKLGGLPKW